MVALAGFGGVNPADAAEEHREYDFDLAKGLYLYNQGRYAEAERYLKDAFNAKPGDQKTGYYLGLTSLRLQRYREAEDRFREVLRRHPEDARARMGLGMALYHQDRQREASTELATAERTLTDDPLLYYYAGLAAADQQAYEQASDKFLRAGKLDPELASDARYQRGAALHSQRQFQEASTEFRSAIENGPAAPQPARPAAAPTPQAPLKRWSASYGLSLQYDSNVVLLPGGYGLFAVVRKNDAMALATTSAEMPSPGYAAANIGAYPSIA